MVRSVPGNRYIHCDGVRNRVVAQFKTQNATYFPESLVHLQLFLRAKLFAALNLKVIRNCPFDVTKIETLDVVNL